MNARVVVAEANNPGTGAHSASRIIRVVKPQNDQAVSIRLEGDARLDLSDVGTEKLIFVRVGDRLVILFDNQSAVGIEGAFDANGQPSPDLSFLVDGNHIVSGTDFAALFPVTTDPSILPAAGNAAGGPTSGASFHDATVDGDGFGGRIPLDLVAGEDGGDRTVTGENARLIASPAVRDAPVARDDAFATSEDAPKTGNVLADNGSGADTGVDAASLRVVAGTFATLHGGTVVVQANGDFTYTPPANYNGPDSFSYTLTDGTLTDTATASISITPVNDVPVARNDAFTTSEDTPKTGNVLADNGSGADSDVDGPNLGVVAGTFATLHGGTVVLQANGDFTYTPPANHNGPDSFTYTLTDGTLTGTATANISITPVNDAPVARNDAFTTNEDTPKTGNVLADNGSGADSDVDGPSLSVVAGTFATLQGGTVVLQANGDFTYTPPANHDGPDSFTYTLTDGTLTGTATANISITPVNDAPVARNDAFTTNEDTPKTGNVLADNGSGADSDVDGPSLSVVAGTFATLQGGTVVLQANGDFTYTPPANHNGPDSFTYTLTDGTLTDAATVSIAVNPVNDAPVAANDSYRVDEDASLSVAAAGVLANDSDIDGNQLSAVLVAGPAHGTLTFNADGSFVYTPTANYNGADSFTYQANDGSADSSIVTVNLTVNPVNDAPVAAHDAYQVNEDGSLSITAAGVLANDSDIDGDPLAAVLVAGPAHGTLTLNANGSFVYTPTADYHGADSFTYQANDGSADSNVVTVDLTVNPVNDAPILNAIAQPESVPEAGNAAAQDIAPMAGHLSVSDVDVGDTLTASVSGAVLTWSGGALSEDQIAALTSALVNGKLSFDGTVTATGAAQSIGWSWDPAAADLDFLADGQTLTVTYSVQVSDGTVATASQPLTFTIAGSNDAPVITSNGGGEAASISVAENQTAVLTVASTDLDANATRTYTITGGADAALFAIDSATGELKFIAAPDFETPADADGDNVYNVQVKVSDGDKTDIQDIAVTVTDVNEAPSMTSPATVSVAENGTSVMTVTSIDPDAGATASYTIVGGADAALFTLDQTTGELKFIAPPNFETPADAGGNNVYDVKVQVSDGALTAVQDIAVTVTNVNEAPVITSAATVGVAENQTAVLTLASSDPDAHATGTWTITGGADAALFSLDAATGQLKFIHAPNFETPADAGGDNVYDVQVRVSDGALTATQDIAVTVTDANDAPVITSSAAVAIGQHTTAVMTVTAFDPDAGATKTWSIAGGADAHLLTIDQTTGALAFIHAPDFHAPADAGGDNVYDVQVKVSDGMASDTQSIAITVQANSNPVAVNDTILWLTNADTDLDIVFSDFSGRWRAALNDGSGTFTTQGARYDDSGNNMVLADIDHDGDLDAVISGAGVLIQMGNGDGTFVANASAPIAGTAGWKIAAGDLDGDGDIDFVVSGSSAASSGGTNKVLLNNGDGTFAVSTFGSGVDGGSDVALGDLDGDGDLDAFVVQGTDGTGASVWLNDGSGRFAVSGSLALRGYAVALADFNGDGRLDAYVGTGSDEIGPDHILYGNGDGTFSSDVSVPGLYSSFVATGDLNGDGRIDVVTASYISFDIMLNDGAGGFTTTSFAFGDPVFADGVTLGDVNGDGRLDIVLATSSGAAILINDGSGGFSMQAPTIGTDHGVGSPVALGNLDNTRPLYANAPNDLDVLANDTDADGDALTITGVGTGGIGASISISADGHSVVYDASGSATARALGAGQTVGDTFTYTISDGHGGTSSATVTVKVTGVNDAPVITSATTATEAENTPAGDIVYHVAASDPDANAVLAYSLSGADRARFTIDNFGNVRFVAAPDFEAPADADHDNKYQVTVNVSDGTVTTSRDVTISVTNVNDAPQIAAAPILTVSEGGWTILTAAAGFTATDEDNSPVTLNTFATSHGAFQLLTGGVWSDVSSFTTADVNAGHVRFLHDGGEAAPSFGMSASDGSLNSQAVQGQVVFTNVNDAPVMASPVLTVSEGGSVILTAAAGFTAIDDDSSPVTLNIFSTTGGAFQLLANGVWSDVTSFTTADVDAGHVRFLHDGGEAPPNFVIQASDGSLTSAAVNGQVVFTHVNDAPVITSDGGGDAAALTVAENQTAVTTVTSADPDSTTLTYAISGGADAALFTIDSSTGELKFIAPPDFETPADAGADNVYHVQITVSDGDKTDIQDIAVTVADVNDAPSITSAATVSVAENQTAVMTVTSSDPDTGATASYAIVGGADAAKFTIDAVTGVLKFVTAPNFEVPADAGGNNVYDVTVQVSDGALTDTRDIAVTVSDVVEAPGTNHAPQLLTGSEVITKTSAQLINTIDVALNLDGHFRTGADPDIANATAVPHVSIEATGGGQGDFYAFTVTQAGTATFDIDHARGAPVFDSYLRLFNAAGQLIAFNDDSATTNGAGGSGTAADAFLSYNFTTPGTYYIAVGNYDDPNSVPNGWTYQLQVSLPGAETALDDFTVNGGAPAGAVGTLVSSLVDLAGDGAGRNNVVDQDPGAVAGIALTATDSANGVWWYSLDNGASWTLVGAVSNTSALLLAADTDTRLYFQANAGFQSAVTDAITFRAWDQTNNVAEGTRVDVSANGGSSAFSSNTATVGIEAPNVAPTDIIWNAVTPGSGSQSASGVIAHLSATDPNGTTGFTYQLVSSSPSGYLLVSADGTVTTYQGSHLDSSVGYILDVMVTDDHGATYLEQFAIRSGREFDEVRSGSAVDDIMYGLGGNDLLNGAGGNDTLFGQDGNDTLKGGAGNDVLDGGAGTDLLDLSDATAGIAFTLVQSGSDTVVDLTSAGLGVDTYRNIEGVIGSGFADTLVGTAFADVISGGAGDDTITGGAGADTIDTGTGHDTVVVHAVVGSSSDSAQVHGPTGQGDNTGQDTITGFDLGSDTLLIVATGVNSFVHGHDTAIGTAAGLDDGTAGSFLTNVGLIGLDQSRTGFGDTGGTDWNDPGDIAINFADPTGGTFNEASFEARLQYDLTGTDFNDLITTGALNDTITGGLGADRINSGAGSDTIVVHAEVGSFSDSARVAIAGPSNDTGQDTITGFDLTTDTMKIVATGVSSFVHGLDTTIGGTETRTHGEESIFDPNNDGTGKSFLSTVGLVDLNKMPADGTETTGVGDWDGLGDIAVTFASPTGGTWSESSFEARLQYDLTGTDGNDVITTGALNDILTGGQGNDILTGGAGADTFKFSEAGAGNADTIIDYSFAQGDELDLSGLLDAAFGNGSVDANFVRLVNTGNDVKVQVDTDGTGSAATWADVATLQGYHTAGNQVLVAFEQQTHQLTVAA